MHCPPSHTTANHPRICCADLTSSSPIHLRNACMHTFTTGLRCASRQSKSDDVLALLTLAGVEDRVDVDDAALTGWDSLLALHKDITAHALDYPLAPHQLFASDIVNSGANKNAQMAVRILRTTLASFA